MGHVIVVTSGKGGVGKTTISANIAFGLSNMDKKVLVIDTDIGLRNLDVIMGLENRIVYNLVDVIEGKCRLGQAVVKYKDNQNLFLLPSAQTKDKTYISPEQMTNLISDIRDKFDYIIIDCPAGIEQGFKNAIAGADWAIVVATPEVASIRDADRIIGLLEANYISRIDLIINKIRPELVKSGDMMSIEDVTDILALDIIGAITDDVNIVIASNRGEPLTGNSQASLAILNICKRITGENIPLMNLENKIIKKKKGFFALKKSVQ